MKYLVTGASGFVGRALTLKLAREGHEVVALYRSLLPETFMDYDNIQLARGDITQADFLKRAMEGVDGVFHVAGFARPWTQNPQTYYDINERGTINVCEACIYNGVKRLVYTSSAGTHGPQQNGVLIHEETWPQRYYTDYEQSKFNGRKAALSYRDKGLEVVIASPSRVYGYGEISQSNVPARMFRLYLQQGFGVVPGKGLGIGSYVFIDDVVRGHIIAMTEAPEGEEYLLGGDNASYLDLYETMARISGKHYPVIRMPYLVSLGIGKAMLFAAEHFGIHPPITTPWVRKYLKDWGVNSEKIQALGYKVTPLEKGMTRVFESISAKDAVRTGHPASPAPFKPKAVSANRD